MRKIRVTRDQYVSSSGTTPKKVRFKDEQEPESKTIFYQVFEYKQGPGNVQLYLFGWSDRAYLNIKKLPWTPLALVGNRDTYEALSAAARRKQVQLSRVVYNTTGAFGPEA